MLAIREINHARLPTCWDLNLSASNLADQLPKPAVGEDENLAISSIAWRASIDMIA